MRPLPVYDHFPSILSCKMCLVPVWATRSSPPTPMKNSYICLLLEEVAEVTALKWLLREEEELILRTRRDKMFWKREDKHCYLEVVVWVTTPIPNSARWWDSREGAGRRERLNFSVKLAALHECTDILIITCCPIAPQSAPLATQSVAWWGFLSHEPGSPTTSIYRFKLSFYHSIYVLIRVRSQRWGETC